MRIVVIILLLHALLWSIIWWGLTHDGVDE